MFGDLVGGICWVCGLGLWRCGLGVGLVGLKRGVFFIFVWSGGCYFGNLEVFNLLWGLEKVDLGSCVRGVW